MMLDQLLDPKLDDARIPVIGYIRVSMAREEMITVELQRASIIEWAKRETKSAPAGYRIVEWVVDEDKTGRNFKRRIMQAIERVERGEAKIIAVWKFSRFGRNRAGIELNLARIEAVGGKLLSATEDVDATTASGWFQRDVIFSVATFESLRAGEQWEETHKWRRENGLPATGKRRFGYVWHQRKTYEPDGTVNLQEERYEPDPITGPVVAGLYESYINGDSFRALAIQLNLGGFRTTRGAKWATNGVLRFLDSGFAAGYLRVHVDCPLADCTGECPNYKLVKHPTKHHPQIITEDVWQQYLRQRELMRIGPRAPKTSYPMSGYLRCGCCGGGMKRIGPAKRATRLTCRRYDDLGPSECTGSRFLVGDLHAAVLEFLRVTSAPAIEASAATARVPGASLKPVVSPEVEKERIEAEMARLDRGIGKALRTFAMTDDDPDGTLEAECRKLVASLQAERAKLAEQLKAVYPTAESVENRYGKAVSIALGLLEEWDTLPAVRINALLSHVVEKVVVRPGYEGLEIYPTWTPEAWVWSGSGAPALKRKLLIELWGKHPNATGVEIVELAAKRGVSVTAPYAAVVRQRMHLSERDSEVVRRYPRGGKLLTEDRAKREQVRLGAAKRFEAGDQVRRIAADLGIAERTVQLWKSKWKAGGEAGLRSTAVQRKPLEDS